MLGFMLNVDSVSFVNIMDGGLHFAYSRPWSADRLAAFARHV